MILYINNTRQHNLTAPPTQVTVMGKEIPHRYANKLIWALTSIAYLSPQSEWSTLAISPSWLLFVPVVPGGWPLLSSLDQSELIALIPPDGPTVNWQGPAIYTLAQLSIGKDHFILVTNWPSFQLARTTYTHDQLACYQRARTTFNRSAINWQVHPWPTGPAINWQGPPTSTNTCTCTPVINSFSYQLGRAIYMYEEQSLDDLRVAGWSISPKRGVLYYSRVAPCTLWTFTTIQIHTCTCTHSIHDTQCSCPLTTDHL